MGRRLKPDAIALRKFLSLRLTSAEYDQIVARAKAEERTISNYLHRVLFGKKGKAAK